MSRAVKSAVNKSTESMATAVPFGHRTKLTVVLRLSAL